MTSLEALTATLLEVRSYLAEQAQTEEFRNEAFWESGSGREERGALDALARLDEALRQLTTAPAPDEPRTEGRAAPSSSIAA